MSRCSIGTVSFGIAPHSVSRRLAEPEAAHAVPLGRMRQLQTALAAPDVLILDELAKDLDSEILELLEELLAQYPDFFI